MASAEAVHVGRVAEVSSIEFSKPDDRFYPGKPYRITFDATESIKGPSAAKLNFVLDLQYTTELDYLRDHKLEVMLVKTKDYVDEYAEVALDELGTRYSFRLLRPVRHPKDQPATKHVADQLNTDFDSGRMFDMNLKVFAGRDEILKKARSFVKKYPTAAPNFLLSVPNEFGVKCGYTNAYCMVAIPVCKETNALMSRIKESPDFLIRDVPKDQQSRWRTSINASYDKFLAAYKELDRKG